jgi:hypothetical protein
MNSPDAQRCLDKAAECERSAEQSTDDDRRTSYNRLAENWRLLAETHKKIARLRVVEVVPC